MSENVREILAKAANEVLGLEPDMSPYLIAKTSRHIIDLLAAAGFAVVPIEPTEEMLAAGDVTRDFDSVMTLSRKMDRLMGRRAQYARIRAVLTWRAMVAVAPKP